MYLSGFLGEYDKIVQLYFEAIFGVLNGNFSHAVHMYECIAEGVMNLLTFILTRFAFPSFQEINSHPFLSPCPSHNVPGHTH